MVEEVEIRRHKVWTREEAKFLGLQLDSKFTFTTHAQRMRNRALKTNRVFRLCGSVTGHGSQHNLNVQEPSSVGVRLRHICVLSEN